MIHCWHLRAQSMSWSGKTCSYILRLKWYPNRPSRTTGRGVLSAAVIRIFRAAQQRGPHNRDHLRQRIARGREGGSSLYPGLLTARIDA
jgi:hypothetical protein